jgi:DNA-binding MarR family transcriptional regulator
MLFLFIPHISNHELTTLMNFVNPLHNDGIATFFQSKKLCLNEAHANMLECLRHYGTLSQKELGHRLAADYPVTKRLIISLLNYEFVSASQNPAEKRNNLIELSEAGETILYCLHEKLYGKEDAIVMVSF